MNFNGLYINYGFNTALNPASLILDDLNAQSVNQAAIISTLCDISTPAF